MVASVLPVILAFVLVGLICMFFLASSETCRSVGKVLAGLMLAGVMVVCTFVALSIFHVPLGRAWGAITASVPNLSGMGGGFKIAIPFWLLVFLPVVLLLAFAFGKKGPKSPEAPAVPTSPAGPSAGRMFAGLAGAGIAIAFALLAFSLIGVRVSAERGATVATHEVLPPFDEALQPMHPAAHPPGLDEPLVLLDDEVEEPQTTAAEPEEEATSDAKKADEKPDVEPTDEPPEEDEKPTTVAKSPSGDEPPSWVGRDGFREGAVYMTSVTLDPGPTQQLCEEELLLPAVTEKIKAYASEKLGPDAAGHVRLPSEYVRNQMIGDDLWVEPVKVDSFSELYHKLGREIWGEAAGPSTDDWVRLHALVKFDGDVDSRIEQQWIGAIRLERLQGTAGFMALVLLALASLYAYMRFDLATAGAYRNRLRVAALTAIMLVIVGVVLTMSASVSPVDTQL